MTIFPASGPRRPALWFIDPSLGSLNAYEASQRRHHRARRSRQDHPGRPAAAPIGLLPRESAGGRARHGFQRPRARARHHHPRQGHLDPLERHPHQYRGHPRPCRFRRRGRAHPQHGGWRPGAGRRRRGAASTDQIRGLEGPQGRAQADRGDQQGRSLGRAAGGGGERGVRPVRRARRQRGAARFPDPLWLRQGRLDGRNARGPQGSGHGAAVRPGAPACRAAGGRGGPVPHARHHSGGQSLSRPHRHRAHPLGRGQAEPDRQGARPQRSSGRGRPPDQGARLPRPGSDRRRGSVCRRHRGDRRAAGGNGVAHHLRPGSDVPAAGAADRSAHPGDDLPHQRFAARRHRRRQGAEPGDSRAAPARGRRQRRAADQRIDREGFRWRWPAAASCSSAF